MSSSSLASARRRRATPEPTNANANTRQTVPPPPFPGNVNQPNMGVGLTLPQVIAVVDKRLMTLESFMQSSKTETETESAEIDNFSEIFAEYNSRFDIIADELANLKDTILKLQTYTMDVNKRLLDERIQILSDVATPLEEGLQSGV